MRFIDGPAADVQAQLDVGFGAYLEEIAEQVKEASPEVVVLSAELLFRPHQEASIRRLRDRLRAVVGDTTVVAYVRRPSDYYLAVVQQRLRSDPIVITPGPIAYRSILDPYRAVFSRDLRVVGYGDYDVIEDFASRFLPELGNFAFKTQAGMNVSSSAEIMAAMHDPRVRKSADRSHRIRKHLEADLKRIASNLGLKLDKARLRPEVEHHINHASVDLLWLQDEFEIAFEGVDYAQVRERSAMTLPATVHAICEVDDEALTRIANAHAAWSRTKVRD